MVGGNRFVKFKVGKSMEGECYIATFLTPDAFMRHKQENEWQRKERGKHRKTQLLIRRLAVN